MKAEKPTTSNKKALAKWLDSIQQDSWQLELVISGVAIFLLLGAYEPLTAYSSRIALDLLTGSTVLTIIGGAMAILRIAYFALFITFLLHLMLRGFWIGAVGLRSVSGDFDYEVLDYDQRYKNWLHKRLGSFDDYIERLETQCSVAFSFAFLIFFCVLSLGSFTLAVVGITYSTGLIVGLQQTPTPAAWQIAITAIANLSILFLGLLYLIDFSSLGWFKKKRLLGKVYYPAYRLMGWLTLARIYRPFYYNLIDHPFGRKLVKRLWIIILVAMIGVSVSITRFPYFPHEKTDASIISPSHYLDEDKPEGFASANPSLASRYAERDYLEIFIPYRPVAHDRQILHLYPSLRKAHGADFAIDGPLHLYHSENPDVSNDSLLMAHRSLHQLYLNDSLLTDVPWQFYEHPLRDQPGLRYDLPVYDLPRGKHTLVFKNYILTQSDSLYWEENATITFLR